MESEDAHFLTANSSGYFSLPVKVSPATRTRIEASEAGVVQGYALVIDSRTGPAVQKRYPVNTTVQFAALQPFHEETARNVLDLSIEGVFVLSAKQGWVGAVYLAIPAPEWLLVRDETDAIKTQGKVRP